MGQAIDEQPFPRGVLIAAAALITFSIGVAATARLTGTGATRAIPTEVVTERMVRLTLQKDGSVHASDAATGNDIAASASARIRLRRRGAAAASAASACAPTSPKASRCG